MNKEQPTSPLGHYETCLIRDLEWFSRLPGQLLSSRLIWYWESDGEHLGLGELSALPTVRPLTRLTPYNALLFDMDGQEYWNGEGRAINLFGLDADSEPPSWDDARLRTELARFDACEPSGLQIVLMQICDMPDDYVFVSHQPTEEVVHLLRTWGISLHCLPRKSWINIQSYLEAHESRRLLRPSSADSALLRPAKGGEIDARRRPRPSASGDCETQTASER